MVSSGDGTVRSNSNVTKAGLGSSNGKDIEPADGGYKKDQYGNYRDQYGNYRYGDGWGYRMDDRGRDLYRIHPRERDFMPYHRPGSFYAAAPHYFGYRVSYLPSSRYVTVYTRFGVTYYIYNGVYYRPWRDCYIVCRPPFGIVLDRAVSYYDFRPIRFSYYTNYYRTYDAIYDNISYIAEQNRIIAQNNATIAAQNAAIALNSARALDAYTLANRLGLVQSYAYSDRNYYYQDGVFYIINGNGRYEVIIPPAGALVSSLPDDYETITIGDLEVYRVDDTVYRLVLVEGQPCLEVLGQMYGSLASRYSIY